MADRIREHIIFSGRVQGVGFRYRLSHLAAGYGVTGWVRNEYDGTVSAEIQGLREETDRIIQLLSDDRYIRIDGISREKIELQPEERGFHVRY